MCSIFFSTRFAWGISHSFDLQGPGAKAETSSRQPGKGAGWMVNTQNGWLENHLVFKREMHLQKVPFSHCHVSLPEGIYLIQQIDTFFWCVCDFFWTHMLLVATWGWKEHRENDGWFQQIRSKHGYWGSFEELRSKRCGISWYLFPLWGCDAWGEHREKFCNFFLSEPSRWFLGRNDHGRTQFQQDHCMFKKTRLPFVKLTW